MCWNSDISLNTFLFACFAITFIFIANTFTKYKSSTFENPLVYLLLFEVALMQLIEFFLWRNLKNRDVNILLSKIAAFTILLQIGTLILMINNKIYKRVFIIAFVLYFSALYLYKSVYNPFVFHTSVGKSGHLQWEWLNNNGWLNNGWENIFLVGLLLYIIPLLLINNIFLSVFASIYLLLSLYFYYSQNAWGTMWCWGLNLFLLYFVVDILLIKPFYEYNGLC